MKIKKITKLEPQIQQCLNISGNDHLYYTDDKVITHNCILDSSPNSIENPIDKYIVETAPKDPKNLIWRGARWKYFPNEFKNFIKDGKEVHDMSVAFPFYVGSNGEPPIILESETELEKYHSSDIIWCPKEQITDFGTVSYKAKAMAEPLEFLKDFAGIPAGSLARIFYDKRVLDNVFDNNIPYIYAPILAKTTDLPEHLIWNQVHDKIFRQVLNTYKLRYNPMAPRVLAVDLAKSGDAAGISAMHIEMIQSEEGLYPCYVTDFAISVVPLGGQINIDAFKYFIIDLVELGNMDIRYVGFDSFQSLSFEQGLQRYGIKTMYNSVDKTTEPYVQLIDAIYNKRYYCGKSISVKNNLLSLQYTKRQSGSTKVDHFNGDNIYEDQFCKPYQEYSEESFKNSQVGYYAKDISDTIASCINICIRFQNVLQSSYNFVANPTTISSEEDLNNTLKDIGFSL